MSPQTPTTAERDRLRFKIRQSPVTAALVASLVGVWIATWFDVDRVLFLTLAKVNDRVRAGEIWRLFTASFLHAGPLHLWFNCMAFASIGPVIERIYGRAWCLAAFLVGGAVGMLSSVAFTPAPSVGASAGVFALLGLLLAFAVRQRRALAPQVRKALISQLLTVIGLNVLIGLLARFIDNAAHLGGLAGGFALGFVVRPTASVLSTTLPLRPVGPAAAAPEPTPQAPSSAPSGRGRTYLGWAGQRWKMTAFLASGVPFAAALFRGGDPVYLPLAMLPFVAGAGIAITARCPGCRVRVFWWCVSKLPSNKGLDTAFRSESCPVCGYPDHAASSTPEAA